MPHAVDGKIFTVPCKKEERVKLREANLDEPDRDKFTIFWNNRNARRKQSGTLIWWFKEWLVQRGFHDKAQLIMHTNPNDQHGQDLNHIAKELGLQDGQV